MYPFEIHLTTSALLPSELAHFEAACERLQAKPLVIELARGTHATQPMLSKVVHAPDLLAALALASADAAFLGACYLPVTRTKLETHTDYAHLAMAANGPCFVPYFEWHGKVHYQQPAELLALCLRHQAHLSVNALRGESATRFVTLREFGPAAAFWGRVVGLLAELQGQWPVLKQEAESCLYDSNRALDAGWLTP